VNSVANVLNVLIASPGDTSELRDVVELALHEWNGDRALASGVILLPRRWETNAVSDLEGPDGQSVINHQLVDDADIVIGVFQATLGRATPRAASGTAEELERAKEAGKRVHVYFSSMPLPRDHDRLQLAALDEFKAVIADLGLYSPFESANTLKDLVKRAIEYDILRLALSAPVIRAHAGASPRAFYEFVLEPNKQGRSVRRRENLVIVNDGDVAAEDTTVTLKSLEVGQEAPTPFSKPVPFTLAPNGGVYKMPILLYAGSASQVEATIEWTEDDEPRFAVQTVSFH
jgi:hypothetical protein